MDITITSFPIEQADADIFFVHRFHRNRLTGEAWYTYDYDHAYARLAEAHARVGVLRLAALAALED